MSHIWHVIVTRQVRSLSLVIIALMFPSVPVASLNCDQPPREKTGATNSILHHHTNSKALTMEDDRLWKFSRPEWLNSAWARNSGVYGAGALVGLLPSP